MPTEIESKYMKDAVAIIAPIDVVLATSVVLLAFPPTF